MEIEWKELGFGYMKTNFNVRSRYRGGAWEPLQMTDSEYITIHMAASGLHYGQEAFEGLKAFRCKDGKIRIFRPEENAKRMIDTAEYIHMAAPTVEMFVDAVRQAVKANERFVPPYGTGASLYIRPLLFGSGAQVGVKPATEYMFLVFVTPVGPYFKEGFSPIRVIIDRRHDRAAPKGTGHIKMGGNYAAGLKSGEWAHSLGYASALYLDPKENRYIDECGPANFFGIRDGRYITPDSKSVLPSITNMSIRTLAEELGLKVERRPVPVEELEEFEEAGACGTAAVISPVGVICDIENGRDYIYGDGKTPGPWCVKLYDCLRAIQLGEAEDRHNWMMALEDA